MLFYCNSKENKIYVEISNNFYGVDIYSQGVSPLEDEVYTDIDFDLVLSKEEVFSRYQICEEKNYEFPRAGKKKIVKEVVEEKDEVKEEKKEVKKPVSKPKNKK